MRPTLEKPAAQRLYVSVAERANGKTTTSNFTIYGLTREAAVKLLKAAVTGGKK